MIVEGVRPILFIGVFMLLEKNRAWIFLLLLAGALPVWSQDYYGRSQDYYGRSQELKPPPGTSSSVTGKDWARLRSLVASLGTEQGTQKLFSTNSGLGDSFTSAEHFCSFVAPWRSRLAPLPASQPEAPNVDVELRKRSDGTTTCLLTFHHQKPENAITILKLVWLDDNLMKLAFLKGFAQIPDDNASRNRRYAQEDYYSNQWRNSGSSGRK